MPSHPRSAAIYALNEDVLSHIFSLNGDMFTDHKALDTTRFASQVCRQWRDLLLETPSLWAKLIDICSIYTRRTNEWRNELVQRSGGRAAVDHGSAQCEDTGREMFHKVLLRTYYWELAPHPEACDSPIFKPTAHPGHVVLSGTETRILRSPI